jgi:hypothetical protein
VRTARSVDVNPDKYGSLAQAYTECPALLLTGTKNKGVMERLIDRVYPLVRSFIGR